MPSLATSQDWFEQSVLLLDAHPTTTRITTKYTTAKPRKAQRRAKRLGRVHANDQSRTTASAVDAETSESTSSALQQPKAILTLKAYEPRSGVCLKYETDKAAEVGRVIATLGRLGRKMSALPLEDASEQGLKVDDAVVGDVNGSATTIVVPMKTGTQTQANDSINSTVTGKKKKRGKK